MSLWGVQVIPNANVARGQVLAVMPLGGTFRTPDGYADMTPEQRFRYAVEQGAIVCLHPDDWEQWKAAAS